jgi:16S rRNA C967 or C1407 C5-methylase (RsmB/RsmF family)/NOL1/NOP2/fmu family ribosome biogenesis protein
MTTKLAEAFLHKMNGYLQEQFPIFLASYREERALGLRRNPLKLSAAAFTAISPFQLEPVPWAEEGYYLNEGDRPGKHPYYHAGLYYIQEPSAMAPVELLDVRPGDKVLDLCGAPGGKTTQIAGKLQRQGVVVANDSHPDRVKAMVKNVELFGVTNAVVLNELPERLAGPFAEYFDKILVDAPCSGEGMFRKEPEMAKDWSPVEVCKYASMQIRILNSAAQMLKPGGRLVYSTCTFSAEENEATIARFLDEQPQFRVVPIKHVHVHGLAPGRPEWLKQLECDGNDATGETVTFSPEAAESTRGTARLWPHLLRGEGHFAAVLERELADNAESLASRAQQQKSPEQAKREKWGNSTNLAKQPASLSSEVIVERFLEGQLKRTIGGSYVYKGDFVYRVPEHLPDLSGLKVARPGWFLGTVRKDRFEPSQALALGLEAEQSVRTIDFSVQSPDAIRYLKGETLHLPDEALFRSDESVPAKGYTLVCIDGFPVGWAKWQHGMVKNEYPPGWRWT